MKRMWIVLIGLFGVSAWAPAETDLPGWHLVWSDEFDGDTVDTTKWRIEDAALIKNNELQYYAPDDVYVEDGRLVLRSQRRPMGGRQYTSGLVDTRGKFAQAFGRIEIRAKLPKTQGMWPAHWMLPDDGSWPPEIDIMESVGHQPTFMVMSLHTGTWPELETQNQEILGPDLSADFHTFGLEWEPGRMSWLVDGEEKFRVTNDVPAKPFYLILNTAIGGMMGGDPDETTVFPQYHYIDYVRVYGKEVPGTFFLVTPTDHGRVFASPREDRYKQGDEVILSAVPSIGFRFERWSGDLESTDNPVMVVMDAHKKVVAEFAADPDAPALLSLNKPVTVTSVENSRFPGTNAVDGNLQTRWSSAFSDPQAITVDLGEVHPIEAIRLHWENAYGRDYKIDVSDDGKTWKNIHAKKEGKGGTEEIIRINASGRYVRLTGLVRGREWGYSLWEFSVFGR